MQTKPPAESDRATDNNDSAPTPPRRKDSMSAFFRRKSRLSPPCPNCGCLVSEVAESPENDTRRIQNWIIFIITLPLIILDGGAISSRFFSDYEFICKNCSARFRGNKQLYPRPVRCPDCNYDLQMLTADRCPECGRRLPPKPTNTPD